MKIYNEEDNLIGEEDCNMDIGYFDEEERVVGQRESLVENIQNEDGSVTTTVYDSLDIIERVLIFKLFNKKQLAEKEIDDLEKWFETEYREQFEKCSRKIQLGILMNDGRDPQVVLSELYAQAEINADRINELRLVVEAEENNGSNNN